MDITLGIKLPVGAVSASAIKIIRKHTALSIADIRQRAAEDRYIFECEVGDDSGLRKINRLNKELARVGIEARLFEGGRHEDAELFENLEEFHRLIDEEDEARP